jgi:hypothetical protein
MIMSKETKREMGKWVMELAHHLKREHGVEWRAALCKAHLTRRILRLMGTGVVQFSYRKKDGTMRTARGTLCREASAAFAAYEYVKAVEEVVWPRATFSYWDVDKNGFRSFRAEQLKEIN